MADCTIAYRPYSRNSIRPGFSLLEVLFALIVMGLISALSMPLVVGARNIAKADQLRTGANQGVRAVSDMIGTDIRMAGERFPASSSLPLPPIQITAGSGSTQDEIALRRNLWDGTFPICANVNTGHSTIRVVRPSGWAQAGTYPECIQPSDPSGWPVNLAEVQALAAEIGVGGVLRGYIFDDANDRGEFFDFRIESDANTTHRITKVGSGNFTYSYTLANRPRIYILEERLYRVRSSILELLVNQDTPLRVSAGITGLRALNVMRDGTLSATIPSGMTWRDIASVEITVTSLQTEGPEQAERSLTTRYFPRNVLSR